MPTTPNSNDSREKRLRRLGETLMGLTPEQIEEAIKVAAALLAIKARKNAARSAPARAQVLTEQEAIEREQRKALAARPQAQETTVRPMTPTELEALRAHLPEKDRHRLRPDGKLEPELTDWKLCGGLESPYSVALASPDSASSANPIEDQGCGRGRL